MLAFSPPRDTDINGADLSSSRGPALTNWPLHLLPQHAFQMSGVLPPEAPLFLFVVALNIHCAVNIDEIPNIR
jgi:hypothetical protein